MFPVGQASNVWIPGINIIPTELKVYCLKKSWDGNDRATGLFTQKLFNIWLNIIYPGIRLHISIYLPSQLKI